MLYDVSVVVKAVQELGVDNKHIPVTAQVLASQPLDVGVNKEAFTTKHQIKCQCEW